MGSVSAVDTSDTPNTITVAVDRGRPDLSQSTITVNVTADTQLFTASCGQKSAATMADVAVGDRISVRGTIDASSGSPVYTAAEVSLRVPHGAKGKGACPAICRTSASRASLGPELAKKALHQGLRHPE